jgi:hypothetical protein
MTQLNAKTLLNGDAVFTEFKGALSEQFVFQQLITNEEIPIQNLYIYDYKQYKYCKVQIKYNVVFLILFERI